MREESWVLDPEIPHQRFFEEMTRIPHGSYHEAAYGDYLERFAVSRGLEYKRDQIGNVIMYKPASAGYEDHPYIAIQAHMDMVWNKEEGCEHDFESEPLDLYVENGFVRARGTTLGADDGTGVAYILALLDDRKAKHPPIEAIFTVQEEVGLHGAMALKKEEIRSRQLISLDCGGGDSIYISSLGGTSGTVTASLHRKTAEEACFRLSVSGLKGGYTSAYMEEHANAIHLLARILKRVNDRFKIRLSALEGGQEENLLAKTAEAVFCCPAEYTELDAIVARERIQIARELGPAEPDLNISLCSCTGASGEKDRKEEHQLPLIQEDSNAVLNFLYLIPCGFLHKHTTFPEIMSACINCSYVHIHQNTFLLNYAVRGSADSMLRDMEAQIQTLAELTGMENHRLTGFPAWEFHDSRLLKTLQSVYRDLTGNEIGLIPVQGGLECGVFAKMYDDMDIIAMGPFGFDVHTPNEHMDLGNFNSLYLVFEKLLAEL